jgi:hypothetical protein
MQLRVTSNPLFVYNMSLRTGGRQEAAGSMLLESRGLRKGRVENSQRNETVNIVAGRRDVVVVFCTRNFRSNRVHHDLQFE